MTADPVAALMAPVLEAADSYAKWAEWAVDTYSKPAQIHRASLESTLRAALAAARVQGIKEWVEWFERTGNGSMTGKTDAEYQKAMEDWFRDGRALIERSNPGTKEG